MIVANTGLVTPDTGTDLIEIASLRLVRHLGIGNQGAGHAAHVGLPFCQNLFRQLWLIDASGNKNRAGKYILDGGSVGAYVSMFERHRRHHMG